MMTFSIMYLLQLKDPLSKRVAYMHHYKEFGREQGQYYVHDFV